MPFPWWRIYMGAPTPPHQPQPHTHPPPPHRHPHPNPNRRFSYPLICGEKLCKHAKPREVFQTTFSNAFSWMKMFKFRLRSHWNISQKYPYNNIPSLFQIMAWRRSGDKPLSEPLMISWLMHICVTRPQGVNQHRDKGMGKLLHHISATIYLQSLNLYAVYLN